MLLAHRRNLDHRIGYRGRCSTPIGLNPGGELGVPVFPKEDSGRRASRANSSFVFIEVHHPTQKQTYEDAREELDHYFLRFGLYETLLPMG